ncbi:efflux transporter outer membrane subunit [Govanella unica]|uniref:Efflux transporter outer membrane subunit n=1 Tax=Govanella unica TaxID=2975056 RepID=A0A9X3TZP8_9PROT|nr:efflux transporter outer membrane subunit [Govania unica]MDA5194394.1 efflux transporter outer membrane subunit [Govania unica]
MRHSLRIAVISLLCSACAVGPNYHRPSDLPDKKEVPDQYKEASAIMRPASPADLADRGEWWRVYDDPLLDQLMVECSTANQTLVAAEASYRQALAVLAGAKASLWPVIGANGGVSRGNIGSGSSTTTTPGTTSRTVSTVYTAGLTASWEPDVWGRIRRTIESDAANAQSSADTLAATRLSLQAQLATNYASLRIVDAQAALLKDTVAAYERSLTMTQNRYKAGVVAKTDVMLAQTQLLAAQAQAIDTNVLRTQLEHAIAALIGKPPASFALAVRLEPAMALPDIPAGVPSQMLERRPDVASAERLMAAANAQIGVAVAAFFPTITLSGSNDYSSVSISDLFNLPNRVWSLGADLALTIFDGGARFAVRDQAAAAYDQSVANYRQTVLTALQNVEDNLSALRVLGQEYVVQAEAVKAAELTTKLTINQYKAGTVSYLNVVTAQATEFTAKVTSLQIMGQRYNANIALIKALGGGWS